MLKIVNLTTGILKQVNLTLTQGETVAIVGKSGCGKTTLLNAVAGYREYQGQILLDNQELAHFPPWQRDCRYLNQRLYLFPHKTVAGNLHLANPNATECQQRALLAQLQIEHLLHRYPHQLSGGEQQRAALARAIIHPPKLLLLDEPFSALDWSTRKQIWQCMKTVIKTQQITTLLVTHEPQEASYLASRQIQLEQGQIRACSTLPQQENL